jgi:hypothetical protein
MHELLTLLGGFVGIALAVGLTIFTGHWVLRPMAKEARLLNLPRRFTLGDFVWLLLLLQIVLAAVVAIAPPDLENAVPLAGLLLFFGGSASALWTFGISSLSRAGVTQSLRRGVFTVFLLPALLLLMMATGMGCFAVFPMILILLSDDSRRWSTVPVVALYSVIGFLAWALVSWVLRKVAEWVLSGNRTPVQRQPNATDLPPPPSPFA